jgi:hypothetical protein
VTSRRSHLLEKGDLSTSSASAESFASLPVVRFRFNSADASHENRSVSAEQLDDSIIDILVSALLVMRAYNNGCCGICLKQEMGSLVKSL